MKTGKHLVTGGAGFIGSQIVDHLIDNGHEVVVVDDESAECNEKFYWNENAENHKIDICDYEKLSEVMEGIETVFHLAAESRLQPAIINPKRACDVNFMGTYNVLQCARENHAEKVVYSSTSSAYGLANQPPLVETMSRDCLNPYSVSKVAAEDLCKMYYQLYGLKTVVFRYFNVYGDRMPSTGQYAPVLGIFLRQIEEGKPLTVVGDGTQRRDFVHVSDVVRANMMASHTENKECYGEVFNIGSGKNHSIIEIANAMGEEIEYLPKRDGEAETTIANITKSKIKLGWHAKKKLEDWIKDNK